MLSWLLDAVFPKRSLDGEEGEWVTEEERATLRSFPIVESAEQLQLHGIHHLDRLIAGSTYKQCPLLKNAIWTFKFRRVPALGQELAKIMLATAACHPSAGLKAGSAQGRLRSGQEIRTTRCTLVPVPLHWTRRFWRGFNQSAMLAEIVSNECRIPIAHVLRRIRPTGFQSHRARKERWTALRDAFRVTGDIAPNIILVDDVATTGATLDACAKVLKAAGASRVEGWVIARG